MEDNHIEKTVASLSRFREMYSEKVRVLDNTIAVIRALPAEEAALSLVAELPGVPDEAAAAELAHEAQVKLLEHPAVVKPERKRKKKTAKKVTPQKPGKSKSGHGIRKGTSPGSKYQGVVKARLRGNGTHAWKAVAYSPGDQKNHYLGQFEIEEEAAAEVQEFLGNKTEAKRLRDLADAKGGQAKPAARKKTGEKKRTQIKLPSEYKGVSKCVGPQGVKFEAQFWDGKKKKLTYLGRFDSEIEAAVAAAKARGDSDEVRRLSDMLEQMENNQDRPGAGDKHDYEPTEEPDIVYRCKHCRIEYQSRPEFCIGCNSAGFDEVPNPGK